MLNCARASGRAAGVAKNWTGGDFVKMCKTKHHPARCKQVLCVLCNRLETVDLLREEVHPVLGTDYDDEPVEVAVVEYLGLEVAVPLGCVVFLQGRIIPRSRSPRSGGADKQQFKKDSRSTGLHRKCSRPS